jgi:Holliday junction resolvasome RuvABC endonuclease subunit
MPITPTKILAIDPGTKELGVASLAGDRLEFYGVKTFKQRQPPHVLLASIASYITTLLVEYQPTLLAIEQTYRIQRESALLNIAALEIKQTARQRGLPVYEYAPVQVRQQIGPAGKGTKAAVAQVLAARYPELAHLLRQPTRWEALYRAHIFDAVAVGLFCWQQLNEGQDEHG